MLINKINLELSQLQKSITIFINSFIFLVFIDLVLIYFFKDSKNIISSLIILTGLFLSRIIIKKERLDVGITALCLTFYFDGIVNAFFVGNYITLYFILLCAPVVSCLLINNLRIKVFLVFISVIIFLLSNYFLGFFPFENYYFFFGLIPMCLLMTYFSNKLKELHIQNHQLISHLNEKNEELVLFTNMMSHDLKSPLKTIVSFSQLLKRSLPDIRNRESDYLKFIIEGCSELRNLIDSLLQYSKLNSDEIQFQNVDIDYLVNRIIKNLDFLINEKNVKIEKEKLGNIKGHESSLYLLFQNIISNAIKFQPKEKNHKPKIAICQNPSTEFIEFEIADNGIGIQKDKLSVIFEPFKKLHASSEYKGTGLGMSIVKKIVEKHGGKINVNSIMGEGTKFIIKLPVCNSINQL